MIDTTVKPTASDPTITTAEIQPEIKDSPMTTATSPQPIEA